MPPTTSIAPIHSLRFDVKKISKRQLIPPVVNPETSGADTKTDITGEAFAPYSPPPSLHAAILPSSTVSEPSGSGPGPSYHQSHPTGEIIAIAVSVVFAGLLCILALILVLSRLKSKKPKMDFKRIFAKHRAVKTTNLTPPPEDLVIIDIRAKTPGTGERAQDVVHLEIESEKSDELEGSIKSEISEGPVPPLHVPPSVSSQEYAVLGDDVPRIATFWSRMEAEEADSWLATSIAKARPRSEFNSMANSLATRSSWDRRHRTRQGSDASESTQETAGSNIFSIGTTTYSSKTSIRRGGNSEEDMEFEEDVHTEEMAFELARAQTQSVEIKRGVLINWGGDFGGTSCGKFGGSMLPSVMVTCPSSLSSISVDLNEFPLPPDDFVYIVET